MTPNAQQTLQKIEKEMVSVIGLVIQLEELQESLEEMATQLIQSGEITDDEMDEFDSRLEEKCVVIAEKIKEEKHKNAQLQSAIDPFQHQ